MKKRLLAMAMCLVMVTSLLPITAAAEYTDEQILSWIDGITPNGTYCGDTYFTISVPEGANLHSVGWDPGSGTVNRLTKDDSGRYKLDAGLGFGEMRFIIDGEACFIALTIYSQHVWSEWTPNGDGTHSRTCGNGCVDSPQKEFCADNDGNGECDTCCDHIHSWQVHFTENSMKAKCTYSGCTLGEVGVTLNAHSVTLPDPPFNATVDVTGDFKEAFPGAEIGPIRYDYQDSEGVWHYDIDPIPANAKAGQYQAGVSVSGIPMGEDAAARALSTNDGANQATGSAFLFVKYTAADPTVTAQTGDSRPIEIMMGSVVVFSILAAAAFVLDSKRKYRQ